MKYLFKERSNSSTQKGEIPIDFLQLCWYDMNKDGKCYDEDYISPREFNIKHLMYIDTKEEEGCSEKIRLFVHHKQDGMYELCLHKLTQEQWEECDKFNGGKD